MKRCIKWLIDLIKLIDWEDAVGFTISGLLGFVIAYNVYIYIDTIPATPADYEQLERQANAIQQNPDLLQEIDCNIKINGESIIVEFENDECSIVTKYDKNFKVLSISKEDKSWHWLVSLVIALEIGWIEVIIVGLILCSILKKIKKAF